MSRLLIGVAIGEFAAFCFPLKSAVQLAVVASFLLLIALSYWRVGR